MSKSVSLRLRLSVQDGSRSGCAPRSVLPMGGFCFPGINPGAAPKSARIISFGTIRTPIPSPSSRPRVRTPCLPSASNRPSATPSFAEPLSPMPPTAKRSRNTICSPARNANFPWRHFLPPRRSTSASLPMETAATPSLPPRLASSASPTMSVRRNPRRRVVISGAPSRTRPGRSPKPPLHPPERRRLPRRPLLPPRPL